MAPAAGLGARAVGGAEAGAARALPPQQPLPHAGGLAWRPEVAQLGSFSAGVRGGLGRPGPESSGSARC